MFPTENRIYILNFIPSLIFHAHSNKKSGKIEEVARPNLFGTQNHKIYAIKNLKKKHCKWLFHIHATISNIN